jgi:hypothetical protein
MLGGVNHRMRPTTTFLNLEVQDNNQTNALPAGVVMQFDPGDSVFAGDPSARWRKRGPSG